MPAIVQGSPYSSLSTDIINTDHNYKYPGNLNLRPGSKLHQKIVDEVMKRALDSSGQMVKRHQSWRACDETLTTYVKPETYEQLRDNDMSAKSRQKRLLESKYSQEIEIVFPYSYTILETLLSYMMATFTQDPLIRYEGVGSEDVVGAKLLEKVIAIHTVYNKVGLALHTLFRDGFAYGIGLATPFWREVRGRRRVQRPRTFMGVPLVGMYETVVEEGVVFEGNDLENLDPYNVLPDINVPIHRLQDGEYFGWIELTNRLDLLSDERNNDSLFNCKYLKALSTKGSTIYKSADSRDKKSGVTNARMSSNYNPVDCIHMYVKLIPKEWGLGKGEYPEKWYFCLANDQIVIAAEKLDLDHDKFPVIVFAPEFDGYSSSPISKIEVLDGLQTTLDWLFNAHIKNVRKAINDMWIVDPSMVNVLDIENPRAGKVIRTRKAAWGRDVKTMVSQFPVNDVTRQNVNDASFIMSYMDKVGAVDSAMQGSLRQGGPERLTGAEFQGTQRGAFNRLNRLATICGMQALQDLGQMFAAHTQQFMSSDVFVKIVGNLSEELTALNSRMANNRVRVSPADLYINYDVIVRDGSIPQGSMGDVWVRVFEIVAQQPELMQRFDITRIFAVIAKDAGITNIEQFERVQPTQMPTADVQDQVTAGNLVPMENF